jgi:DNA-binding NarL/FixJ family response regulator
MCCWGRAEGAEEWHVSRIMPSIWPLPIISIGVKLNGSHHDRCSDRFQLSAVQLWSLTGCQHDDHLACSRLHTAVSSPSRPRKPGAGYTSTQRRRRSAGQSISSGGLVDHRYSVTRRLHVAPASAPGIGPLRSPISVLIIDNRDQFRTGLVALLGTDRRIEVVGQASAGRAGVRLASELRPDVVLISLDLPDVACPTAIQMMVSRDLGLRIVILAALASDTDVANALGAGASGFIARDTPTMRIFEAILAAAHGAAWLSPRAARVVLDRFRQASAAGSELPVKLTEREVEVLRLIARGMSNDEIAQTLRISRSTAKNHVGRILEKLQLPNRLRAATYAIGVGMSSV